MSLYVFAEFYALRLFDISSVMMIINQKRQMQTIFCRHRVFQIHHLSRSRHLTFILVKYGINDENQQDVDEINSGFLFQRKLIIKSQNCLSC